MRAWQLLVPIVLNACLSLQLWSDADRHAAGSVRFRKT